MIHLHTLGDTLITVGEKEIRPSSPMVFAALLYLGVERGRRVPRAALQEMLFPESDERSGSHSVRQLLYKLRQLGAPLFTDPSSVSLLASDVVDDCAVDEVCGWSHQGVAKSALGFAPDYSPGFSARFEDWLEHQRATVFSIVRSALAAVLVDRRAKARWAEVASVAQLLLGLDPLNEEATLALAEAAAAAGSKHQALGLLSAYERETGSALRLAPTLVRRRISNLVELSGDDPQRGPFIGRSAEVAAILARLSHPERFDARVNVIVGEPGIGKSRLLEELRRARELEGGQTFVAKCRPDHEHRPLGVFIALVPELLQSRGALGVDPESLVHLRQFVQADHAEGAGRTSGDDVERSESLRKALLDLVDAIANEQPLLLAIEDVHWCDSASLRELNTLASRVSSLRIVLTSRSLDPLKASLADVAAIFRLTPLQSHDMDDLATNLLGGHCRETIRRWCVEIAAGNPLFLHMLCAHVTRTGSCGVPKDLKTLIASRLALLPDLHLRALQYVSLLGEYATVESLRDLLDLPPGAFVSCISNLEDQGYFIASHDGLRLTHDLVNDVAQSLAPPLTIKALHAHVASSLEHRFEITRNIGLLWGCAEQWRLSGESDKATALVRRCAAHASALGQSTRALELLTRAKAVTKGSHHLTQLLADMILAAKAAGQLNDVLSLHHELRSLSSEQHSETELLGLEAEWLLNDTLDPEQLLACVQLEVNSAHHRLEACALIQRYAHETCDEALAHKAYSAVRDLLPAAPLKQRLLIEATFHTTFGDVSEGMRAINQLLAAIPSFPLVSDRVASARNVAIGLLIFGRPSEAIEVADRYREVARDLGLFTREYEFKAVVAACFLATKDYESARPLVAELEAPPDSRWLNLYRQLKIDMSLADNDAVAAARLVDELKSVNYGRMARNRSFISLAELRLKQLDPDYLCDPEQFTNLMQLHNLTKRYISDDDFAHALAEDRRRHGEPLEGLAILDDYIFSSRRQCWVLPKSLESLRTELQQAVGTSDKLCDTAQPARVYS